MNIVVKIYDWVSDRMAEPSSYAAIGAVVIGFILKEKGII